MRSRDSGFRVLELPAKICPDSSPHPNSFYRDMKHCEKQEPRKSLETLKSPHPRTPKPQTFQPYISLTSATFEPRSLSGSLRRLLTGLLRRRHATGEACTLARGFLRGSFDKTQAGTKNRSPCCNTYGLRVQAVGVQVGVEFGLWKPTACKLVAHFLDVTLHGL